MQSTEAMEDNLSILVGQMTVFTDATKFPNAQIQTLKPTLKTTLDASLKKLTEEERFTLLAKLPEKNRPRLLLFITNEQDKSAWVELMPPVREKELEQLTHRLHVLLQNVTISTSLRPKLVATINADLATLSPEEQTDLFADLGLAKLKRLPSLISATERAAWQARVDNIVQTEEDLKAKLEQEAELLRQQIDAMAAELEAEHEARLAAEQQHAATVNHMHHMQTLLEAEQRAARLREQEAASARQAAIEAEAARQAAVAQQHALEAAARQALNERLLRLHTDMTNLNKYQDHGQANTLAIHSNKLLEDIKTLRQSVNGAQLDATQCETVTQLENTAQRQHKRGVAIAAARQLGL